ncbi:MAG: hypothetical protein MJH09_13210, partial [Cetobacterium sp.]|nr:hypothetical protein [Cetobacterium sp.]
MKRIYKNIFLLFIFFTINIFSSKDAIIAPKKYKPAEMNLEITKVKLKEIEGTINEVKKELYISKKDLTVDTNDILFITEEKNKLRENFNFQKKDILNNKNYVFTYKQHKDNIYLVHSDKEKIKGIYKIIFKNINYNNNYLYIYNINKSPTTSPITFKGTFKHGAGIGNSNFTDAIIYDDTIDFFCFKKASNFVLPKDTTYTITNNGPESTIKIHKINNNEFILFEFTFKNDEGRSIIGTLYSPYDYYIKIPVFNKSIQTGWIIINGNSSTGPALSIKAVQGLEFIFPDGLTNLIAQSQKGIYE